MTIFSRREKPADAGTRVILIGETNRAATGAVLRTLGEREFCARAVGNALVVVGKTEALTVRAAEKLTALLTPDGTRCIRFTPDMAFLDTAPDALRVSFLGDSITTYAGYSDSGSINATLPQNPTWYGKSKMDVSQTWWYRVTGEMGWELCVNNSYSGGRVSNAYSYETRAKNLHTADGQQPDVILIYYGINDYNNMVPLATFRTAYSAMLDAIRTAYPEATVYCATLIPILCTDNGRNTTLTANGAGIALTEFNRVIGTLAGAKNANVIDFAAAIGAGAVPVYLRQYPSERRGYEAHERGGAGDPAGGFCGSRTKITKERRKRNETHHLSAALSLFSYGGTDCLCEDRRQLQKYRNGKAERQRQSDGIRH